MNRYLTALRSWSIRNWLMAAMGFSATILFIGLPTAMIENPFFGREIPPTLWAWPLLIITATLIGLLVASYVASGEPEANHREFKFGSAGSILGFFAVGCPVCNKLVVIAMGSTGAMNYFAPIQPILAVVGVFLLGYALHLRLINQDRCRLSNSNSRNNTTFERSSNGNN